MRKRSTSGAKRSKSQLDAAVELVKERLGPLRPRLGMILGSGFHGVAAIVKASASLDYTDMPCFPKTGVKGHSGRLIVGKVGETEILILSGRAHYYEGYSMAEITFPVRVIRELGIEDLVVTNAAGGVDRKFLPGDFMLFKDHVNLMGVNPLRPTRAEEWDGTFLDLSMPYDPGMAKMMMRAAKAMGLKLRSGVYAAVSGPTYETRSEVKMLAKLGATAVGMSTVPEVIVARQCGMRVAGLSLITNAAAGISEGALSHAEVLETGNQSEESGRELIRNFCNFYDRK